MVKNNVLQVLKEELAELDKEIGVLKKDLNERQAELDKKKSKLVAYKKQITEKLRTLRSEKDKYEKAIMAVEKLNGKN